MNALLAFALVVLAILMTGYVLGRAQHRAERLDGDNRENLIEQVNALLPQTQCAQCNYPGCRPYATAIVDDDAGINQCPPGGDAVIQQLASLLDRPVIALNIDYGEHKPAIVALIDEAQCIGCKLCIDACPVDAIVGARKYMHSVISDECTGCELCLPPCPVDCIDLVPANQGRPLWSRPA